jgi:hypothetical protein
MSGDDLICALCVPIFNVHRICPLFREWGLTIFARRRSLLVEEGGRARRNSHNNLVNPKLDS